MHGTSDDTFVPSLPPLVFLLSYVIYRLMWEDYSSCNCVIGLFLCMYSCFCGVGFLLGFSYRFFSFFPLVGVGQHLPKSCLYCVCCVLYWHSNYDVLVWRAQSAVHNPIGSNYAGVHRAPYIILADACLQHISCG